MRKQKHADISPQAMRMRRLRAARKRAGSCSECEDPPVPGGEQCQIHRDVGKYRVRRLRMNRRRKTTAVTCA